MRYKVLAYSEAITPGKKNRELTLGGVIAVGQEAIPGSKFDRDAGERKSRLP